MIETISIERIDRGAGTQSRANLDGPTVDDYAAAMRAGDEFPPIELIYDGESYYLKDGFHRVAAAIQAGFTAIEANFEQGTLEEAKWDSYSLNTTHGLRRSRKDTRRAIIAALKHPYSASSSNVQLANHIGVDEGTIRRYRQDLESTSEIPKSDQRTGGDGRTIHISNIGTSKVAHSHAEFTAGQSVRCLQETDTYRESDLAPQSLRIPMGRIAEFVAFRIAGIEFAIVDYLGKRMAVLLSHLEVVARPELALGDTVRTRAGQIGCIVQLEPDQGMAYLDGDTRGHDRETLTKIDPLPVANAQHIDEEMAIDEQLAEQVLNEEGAEYVDAGGGQVTEADLGEHERALAGAMGLRTDDDERYSNDTFDDYSEEDEKDRASEPEEELPPAPWSLVDNLLHIEIQAADGTRVAEVFRNGGRGYRWAELLCHKINRG